LNPFALLPGEPGVDQLDATGSVLDLGPEESTSAALLRRASGAIPH
jgi:hypothetical protein